METISTEVKSVVFDTTGVNISVVAAAVESMVREENSNYLQKKNIDIS